MKTSNKPIIKSHFIYKNDRYDVEFFEIKDNKIPSLNWSQVYAIGNLDGKVPIVKYQNSRDNLPGGGVEDKETVEEALHREIKEELNMAVLNWFPLGYQKVSDKLGNIGYQLRVYAELEVIGKFINDIGGSVVGYEMVHINDVNEHIKYGEVGDWLIDKVRSRYGKNQ